MTTEIAKFDPTTYVDKVRDKIKQSLIDIIPDEQWNTMLKAEISSFFESRVERDQWGGNTKTVISEFHRLAQKVFEEETRRHVKEILDGPEWKAYWDGSKMKVGEEIGRIASENGAAILAKWLEGAIAQVVSSLRFQQ